MIGGLSLLISTLCFMYPICSPAPRKKKEILNWSDVTKDYYSKIDDRQFWGTRYPYHILNDYERKLSADKAYAKYGRFIKKDSMTKEEFAKVCFALERDFLIRNGYAEKDRTLNKIKLKNLPIVEGKTKPWEWEEE